MSGRNEPPKEKPIAAGTFLGYSQFLFMGLLRLFFWLFVFLGATFAFTVLFEHGPSHFVENAQLEWRDLQKLYNTTLEARKAPNEKTSH
jgi:hypothetical protein